MAYKITDDTNYSNIADAIRAKLGSNELFMPGEMADAIESIETGGGGSGDIDPFGKIVFIDYDGTILHGYTTVEVEDLTALPSLPNHRGLVCQGWNWTLAELKEYGRPIVVGANYITDDGATRAYVKITDGYLKVSTMFTQSVANDVVINWGDGSEEETFSDLDVEVMHTYFEAGEYVVSWKPTEGTISFKGNKNSSGLMLCHRPIAGDEESGCSCKIDKIELGRNVELGAYAFYRFHALKTISVPSEVVLASSVLEDTSQIKCIVIGRDTTSIPSSAFTKAYGLELLSIPSTLSSIGSYAFANDGNLKVFTGSKQLSTIGTYAFQGCTGLEWADVGDKPTKVDNYVFNNCYSLNTIVFNNRITAIGKNAFSNCYGLETISLPSSLRTLDRDSFSSCRNVKELIIPASVTELADGCIGYMFSLSKLIVRGKLTKISGSYPFRAMEIITLIDLSNCDRVPTVSATGFITVNDDLEIRVPSALEESFKADTYWGEYADYIVGV